MELIFIILIFAIWIFGFSGVFNALKSTTKATVKTISEGSNLLDNLKEEYREMGLFEVQIVPTTVEIGGKLIDAFDVKVRGLIDAKYKSQLKFVTSLFDCTDGEYRAVISSLDFMQEEMTSGFQNVMDVREIAPNQGYKNWVKVATLFPETLTGTYKGKRTIRAHVRAIPPDQLPLINWGLADKDMIIFSQASADVVLDLTEKGWLESQEERGLARQLMVKIAVSVACADGEMNAAEGKVIQSWIKEQLQSVTENQVERVKGELNFAFKEAFSDSQAGLMDQDLLVMKLKQLDFHSMNQNLLEFLVAVIGADDEITKDEMANINIIGEQLGVDYNDIKAMSDKAFLDKDTSLEADDDLEGILGIDPTWDNPKIIYHLRMEFSKWNGRMQALEDDAEKDKAQKMLDAITNARQKYGAK